MENRDSNRHKADQSIVCTVFTSHSFNDLFDGQMKNYCDSGIYAELLTHLKMERSYASGQPAAPLSVCLRKQRRDFGPFRF